MKWNDGTMERTFRMNSLSPRGESNKPGKSFHRSIVPNPMKLDIQHKEPPTMKIANTEPNPPLAGLILLALVIGHTWGIVCLTTGNRERQRPSHLPSVTSGHLVRIESEGATP